MMIVKLSDGSTQISQNMSRDVLYEKIMQLPLRSVKHLEFRGHASPSSMEIFDSPQFQIKYSPMRGNKGLRFNVGNSVFLKYNATDKLIPGRPTQTVSLAGMLRERMAPGGCVYLNGCNTAYDGLFSDGRDYNKNICQDLSRQLPGVVVAGNRGVALSFNIEWFVFGITRRYLGGAEL